MEKTFGLINIFKRFKFKIIFTLGLVVLDFISNLLIPLFIGYAINDLLGGKNDGLIGLIILIVASIILGSVRRFYDSRVYGDIYQTVAWELVDKEEKKNSSVSKISARVKLLTELIEFFENTFPEIVFSFLGVFGILLIVFKINISVFLLCIGSIIAIVVVYAMSSNKNYQLHKKYNNHVETLVDTLNTKNRKEIIGYFKKLRTLNVKLSDLETINFTLVAIVTMGIFVLSILLSTKEGAGYYGTIVSLVMYVLDFVEKVMIMPLYYQNYVRLKEISNRLSEK